MISGVVIGVLSELRKPEYYNHGRGQQVQQENH